MRFGVILATLLMVQCIQKYGHVKRKSDSFLNSEWLSLTTEHIDEEGTYFPNASKRKLEIKFIKEIKSGSVVNQSLSFKITTFAKDDDVQSRLIFSGSSGQRELNILGSSSRVDSKMITRNSQVATANGMQNQGTRVRVSKNIAELQVDDPDSIIKEFGNSPNGIIRAYRGTDPLTFRLSPEDCESIRKFVANQADDDGD